VTSSSHHPSSPSLRALGPASAVGGWGAAKSLQKVSLSGMSRAAQGIVNASAPRLYFLSATVVYHAYVSYTLHAIPPKREERTNEHGT